MEAREAAPLDIAQLLGGMLVAVLVAFMQVEPQHSSDTRHEIFAFTFIYTSLHL